MLLGAQANTLDFCSLVVYIINSTTVVVLPVPGGPWIIEISWLVRQIEIAYFWLRFSDSFTHCSLSG